MEITTIQEKLKTSISAKRYNHSVSTMQEAVKLAAMYNCDTEKAALAGLLHDCAKGKSMAEMFGLCQKYNIKIDSIMLKEPYLLHGAVGAYIARDEYEVVDEEIFDAIYYHTTGKEDMPLLTKIILIADYTELQRDFRGVQKIRQLAYKNLNEGIVYALGNTITSILADGKLVHPSSVAARNYLILER